MASVRGIRFQSVPHRGFLVFRIWRCHSLSAISVFRAFTPATGARPKQPK